MNVNNKSFDPVLTGSAVGAIILAGLNPIQFDLNSNEFNTRDTIGRFPISAMVMNSSNVKTAQNFPLLDGDRESEFIGAHKALDQMSHDDPEDEWYITTSAQESASYALSLLYCAGLPAPRVASHDEDTICFSWQDGDERIYLTVEQNRGSVLQTTPTTIGVVAGAELRDTAFLDLLAFLGSNVRSKRGSTGAVGTSGAMPGLSAV